MGGGIGEVEATSDEDGLDGMFLFKLLVVLLLFDRW
jgi:hypothetical protein